MRILLVTAIMTCWATGAGAAGEPWRVSPDFKNKTAREHLSGLTCPGPEWCFAVNDEESYGQFFSLDTEDRRIRPGKRLRLLPDAGFDEADLEAASHEAGYVYALGSHGLSRYGLEMQASRFFVFRFPVDPESGEPLFETKRKSVVPEVERSGRLRPIVEALTGLGADPDQTVIQDRGNFEGLAVTGGRLFAGFRAPSQAGHGFVLEVPVDHLFGDAPASHRLHRLPLGVDYGLRGLSPFRDGLLLLASAADAPELVPTVWFWRPEEVPILLSALPVPLGWKPEGILPLGPEGARRHRILVIFDSRENGAPREFSIPLPPVE